MLLHFIDRMNLRSKMPYVSEHHDSLRDINVLRSVIFLFGMEEAFKDLIHETFL